MNELLPSESSLLVPEIPTDLPRIQVDTAWAIDVDRTLSSVDAGLQRLASLGEAYGIPGIQLFEGYQKAKDAKVKFDPLESYRTQLHPTAYKEFCTTLSRPDLEPAITYADTPRFLGRIVGPRTVLTYAQHVPFQRIKLQSLAYRGYAHILDHTNKGPLIESWRAPTGAFDFLGISKEGESLAIYSANRVNLIDDNDQSHQNLPPESTGFYLRRPEETNIVPPSSSLPEGVVAISSLDEIPDYNVSHSLPESPEEPFAYIPLSEARRPLLWLGGILVTSLTADELEGSRTA